MFLQRSIHRGSLGTIQGRSRTGSSERRAVQLSVEHLEGRALLSGGAPDPAFGTGGVVTTDFAGRADFANAVLVQPDGKIVAVGGSRDVASGEWAFAVARYNPDGAPDGGFGAGGQVHIPFGVAFGVTLQGGKIVVVGNVGGTEGFAVLRLNPDGTPDTSFDGDGKVTTLVGSQGTAYDAATQADGKLVVVGSHQAILGRTSLPVLDVVRYHADGSLDTSFEMDGRVALPGATAAGVRLQPDGKIVVAAGGGTSAMAVFRFNTDGSPDAGFGTNGHSQLYVGTGVRANRVAIQGDGKIVAAGSDNGTLALVRFNPDGSPDAAFGNGGVVVRAESGMPQTALSLVSQADGFLLVAGSTAQAGDVPRAVAATRLHPDGSPDPRYGTVGVFSAPFGTSAEVRALDFQADGKLVAAGASGGDPALGASNFVVARYIVTTVTVGGPPNQRFVGQLYLDLLGRPADSSGLAGWSRWLDRGKLTRPKLVQLIVTSTEYQTKVVHDLYEWLLDRPPDPSGLATWGGFLATGGTAEQLAAILLGSAEYLGRTDGTNNGFLQALYFDALQRPLDPGGAQTWGQALAAGVPHSTVAGAVLASLEADRLDVSGLYQRFLHRSADPAGLAEFVTALQEGKPQEAVIVALVGSDEYFAQL